ncbi:MAG: hypothetical protein MRY59_10465 [Aquisalinus sp.]|nr:hypothetical protein [Aquisalinus sp.]
MVLTDINKETLKHKLRHLYNNDIVARNFFDWYQSRGRGSRETKARVAAERTEQDYSDIVELFRSLEDMDLGRFLVGRRGAETRFYWEYDVKSIAEIAVGEADSPEDFSRDTPIDDESEDMLKHAFNLRPNMTVTLKLPENFTQHEAERLAAWIKSLPFTDAHAP